MKRFLQQRLWRRLITFTLLSVLTAILLSLLPIDSQSRFPLAQPAALAMWESGTGIAVRVDATGVYTITTRQPAWTFSGDVGSRLTSLFLTGGADKLGQYQEISFTYRGRVARASSIRAYASRPLVLFRTTYLAASSNSEPFPTFTTYPQRLFHLSYHGSFGVYGFNLAGSDSPWLFFDAHASSFLLSPASNFLQATLAMNGDGSISSGISRVISVLPADFTHATILALGSGINSVYTTWGQAMTALQGKERPANDATSTLDRLGYWTDHGASYYYQYIPGKGYEGTLEAVKQDFARRGIPLGYMQLDSWWYPKGVPPDWKNSERGIALYTADPTLFPGGLGTFQRQLGLPLMVHARWIDVDSPYRVRYKMSGNVSVDPRYWQAIMTYLRQSGVVSYEQDWLSAPAQTDLDLTDPGAFLSEMAASAEANGLSLQYCMPDPRDYLQSTLYNDALTIRVSDDRFDRAYWDEFLYDSRLASALGLWPWSDVFMSTETDNLLLSTLSGGMVGVGDQLGRESKANLLQTIRPDGVIVKPDTSIVPLDETYVADAQGQRPPMVAAASTLHGGLVDAYVFAYSRRNHASQLATFTPASLGIAGSAYVYNYFTGKGTVVNAGQSFSASVGSGSYYIVAPIGLSGIAFLGDAGKFVSLGSKRISRLTDNGTVQATVAFARGEKTVILHGYAPARPRASATNGRVGVLSYNSRSHLFSVPVSPGADSTAVIEMSL